MYIYASQPTLIQTTGLLYTLNMKVLFSSLLLLIVAVNAAPKALEVVQAPSDFEKEQPEDSWLLPTNHADQKPNLSEDSNTDQEPGEEHVSNKDQTPEEGQEESVKNQKPEGVGESSIETRRRLIEDYMSLQRDLMLIRRLLGLSLDTPRPRPVAFNPWSFPSFGPFFEDDNDNDTWFDTWGSNSSDSDSSDNDTTVIVPAGGFLGFPGIGFGFNRPIFPRFPLFPIEPSFPKVDDLPDNYDNSTHEVHVVNGSRVEVNTTTNKESGDGFQTFFHTEVIAIRPENEKNTTTTQTEENTGEEKPVKEEKLPSLPEADNEADVSENSSATVPEVGLKGETDTVTTTEADSILP
nr:uncharacterized protein LOC128699835 [Cherax quadricarinatus]